MNLEEQPMELILQYESSATEIEKALFTDRYRLSKRHFSLLAVQSVSILYSYWEGFIQRSFQLYIDYLNYMSISFLSFSDSIIAYGMESSFKQFYEYPRDLKKKVVFYDKLNTFFGIEYHELSRTINTESNVGFDVLNRLLKQFSLAPFPMCWDKYCYPNPNLKEIMDAFLRYRNGVAHGGDISSEEKIKKDVYAKYRIMLVDLMYEMHNKFLDGIEKCSYMKERGNDGQKCD